MNTECEPTGERRRFTTFRDARLVVEQFEDDLRSLGITIASGSELELICAYIMDLESQQVGQSMVDVTSDVRPIWRRAVGLMSLLDMLSRARQRKQLIIFAPHLRILNDGSVPQNIRTALSDDTCNKVFEMLVALMCLPVADKVELDDPKTSTGDNPDVLASINGVVWGFSCKTPHGGSPKSMFDRLKEGIAQIEHSPAQKGVVYFNFRNLIDHDIVWPEVKTSGQSGQDRFRFLVRRNSEDVNAYYRHLVDAKNGEMLQAVGVQEVQSIFVDKKSIPGAMVYLQSAAAFLENNGHTVMSISYPAMMEFGSINAADMEILKRVLRAAYGT